MVKSTNQLDAHHFQTCRLAPAEQKRQLQPVTQSTTNKTDEHFAHTHTHTQHV